MKPVVAPENVERRNEADRRSHPLRRGEDRADKEFKDALNAPASQYHSPAQVHNSDENSSAPTSGDHAPATRDRSSFDKALMSPAAGDAVANALDQLKNSAMDGLDGKVEALLRPMLRDWLDNNLPSMVERLVRDEIERVSRGG